MAMHPSMEYEKEIAYSVYKYSWAFSIDVSVNLLLCMAYLLSDVYTTVYTRGIMRTIYTYIFQEDRE